MYYEINNKNINEILSKVRLEDVYCLILIVEESILDKKVE